MKIYSKIAFSALCMLLLGSNVYADNKPEEIKVISGIVVDADGMPIEGISVFSTKANKYDVTDQDGQYSIGVVKGDFLKIQNKGYDKKVISVISLDDDNTIELQAWSDLRSEDKINVPYGQMDFDRMTGAATVVSGDELRLMGSYNIIEAMTGRVSGFRVTPNDSRPKSLSFSSSIRGDGGITSVVDGARASTNISTTEVEDVVVLKDLAGSSLFGSNGSNGALYINTKRGKEGESSINVMYGHGMQTAAFLPKMMDGAQFAKTYDQALINDGLPAKYGQEAYDAIADGSNPLKYPNVDYYDEFINKATSYDKAVVEFAGGGSTAKYYSTVDLYSTTGLEKYNPTEFLRFRMRSNLQVAITDFINMDLAIGGGIYNDRSASYYYDGELFGTLKNIPGCALAFIVGEDEATGEPIFASNRDYGNNLMINAKYAGTTEGTYRNAFTRFGLDADLDKFVKGLSIDGFVNIDINNNARKQIQPKVNQAYVDWATDPATGEDVMSLIINQTSQDDNSWGKRGDDISRAIDSRATIHYNRTFNDDHKFSADLGANFYNVTSNSYYWPVNDFSSGLRANYFYKNKYVLDGTVTLARTNTLAEKNRNATFYSVGAGWIASREDFLKNSSWLNYLKVRANYGLSGSSFRTLNGDNSTAYMYQDAYSGASGYSFGVQGSTSGVSGYGRAFTASPDVDWAKTKSLSAGIDARMFDSRLNMQANYFHYIDYDGVVRENNFAALKGSAAAYMSYLNFGKTSQDGVELDLSWRKTTGKFNYVVGANAIYRVSFNDQANEVLYPEEESYRNSTGAQGGLVKGLVSSGVLTDQAAVDAYNDKYDSYFGHVQLGDLAYVDQTGDNKIDNRDIVTIGKSPRVYYGIYATLKYADFSLSIRGEGAAGGKYLNANLRSSGGNNNYYAEQCKLFPFSNELPRATVLGSSNNNCASDFWMRSASYLNIKNVSFSYTLPTSIAKSIFCKSIDLFVVGNNLLVISPEKDVYSPSRDRGLSKYPIMRSVELGFDLKF